MVSIQKEMTIELTKKQIEIFSVKEDHKKIEKYFEDFNIALAQGMNFREARRDSDRRNTKINERTKIELDTFMRSLELNSKKGKEFNYTDALEKVQKTQEMTGEDLKKQMDEQIAKMKENLKKLEKLSAIAVKTNTKETQKMKPVEDKKVDTYEMYLLTTDKITINYDGKDIKKIKISIDNETGSAERLFSLAETNKEKGSVLRNLLENNAKISLYYFDEKGIEKSINANDYKNTLAMFNDEQLGKMLFKMGKA